MRPSVAPEDRIAHAPKTWLAVLAGRAAGQSASRPWLFLTCGAIALLLAVVSIGRLHIAASLTAMLGTDTEAAAAMDRIARDFQASDGILILIELPAEHPGGASGRSELIEFSTRLQEALLQDEVSKPLVEWIRSGGDPAIGGFVRDVVLPNGAFFLSDASIAELLRRIEPEAMQAQFERNEAMIASAGPAASVLSSRVLRDPLRLFELIPDSSRGQPATYGSPNSWHGSTRKQEFSSDRRATLLRVGLSQRGTEYEAAAPIVALVRETASRLNDTGLQIRLGGFAPIATRSAHTIRHDAIVSCIAALVMLFVLFRIFYRKWSAGLIIGMTAAVGLLAGLGVAGLFFQEVSPLAAMIAALLAGLGVDYGIHYLSHLQSCRASGLDTVSASIVAARHMANPLVATCGTTVLGFMSLWFSQIQMLSDFAFLGACGLIGSLFAVFLLVPAAVSVARWSPKIPTETAAAATTCGAPWITRHPRAGFSMAGGAIALLFAAAAMQGFAIPIETDLRVMHPEPNPAMDTTAEIIRRFSGQGEFVPIEVKADSPSALAAAAHATATAMTSEPCRAVGVLQVSGLHQLLPHPDRIDRTRDCFAGSNPSEALAAFQRLVEDSAFSPEAYADYSGVLEQLITPRVAPSVADIVTRAELGSRLFPAASFDQGSLPTTTVLIARLAKPIVDRSQRREVVEALNRAALSVHDADVTVAGVAAVTLELEDAARAGLPRSAIVSVILVLIWLYLFLRSIRSVLLALLPLIFAVVVVILFIMATGHRLNPINAVALPLLAGIAVDAGLFLLAASPIRSGVDRNIAWRLRATSHAVILATSTTTLAFLAMCPSHTPAIQSLGIVSAVGVMAAGFGAIVLLMPLLVTWAPAHLLAERSVE